MSFREAFTKEQRKNLLEYDDNAALYFCCTILLCILIPWGARFVWTLIFPSRSLAARTLIPAASRRGTPFHQCQCTDCQRFWDAKKKSAYSLRNRLLSRSCILQAIGLSILGLFFVSACRTIARVAAIQAFDPFEILGVTRSATDRMIKKAFRTLSLKHHPDKNPNDPSAAAKFIMITKAYQSLTDETARRNYEKYGNPDGPGLMEVGIGLPSFLVDEENQALSLAILLVFLLLVIPLGFIIHYQKQKNFYPNGVRVETVHFFACYVTETADVKEIPEFLAASAESRDLHFCASDAEALKEIASRVQATKKRHIASQAVYRNHLILLGHMRRLHHLMTPEMERDLKTLLRLCVPLTQTIMEVAFIHHWIDVVYAVLVIRRCLVQAVTPTMTPFAQVPHLAALKKKDPPLSFNEFITATPEERAALLNLSDEQMEDINSFCTVMPRLKVSATAKVIGEKDIAEGDVVTVQVVIDRLNLPKGTASGPVHAPYFPEFKFEELWIFLISKRNGNLVTHVRCRQLERQAVEEMRFLAPSPGKYAFQVTVMSDAYVGVDVQTDLSVQVLSQAEAARQIIIHPEDLQLDKEPSLFAQMMGQLDQQEEDDDEDSD